MGSLRAVLVAGSNAENQTLKAILGECETHFVQRFAEGIAALAARSYAYVLVTVEFADSRMFDFMREVTQRQPNARAFAVHGLDHKPIRPGVRDAVEFALEQIGAVGLIDLSAPRLMDKERLALAQIVDLCRPRPDKSAAAAGGTGR